MPGRGVAAVRDIGIVSVCAALALQDASVRFICGGFRHALAVQPLQGALHAIACVAALRDPASGAALSVSQADSLAAHGIPPPTPDLLSTLDVQLPIAAINLLYALAAHSPRVRAWLVSPAAPTPRPRPGSHGPSGARAGANGGGSGLEMLVNGVMPLIFHSMVTVRRAVARLLAALCMGGEADRWTGWDAVARSARAGSSAAVLAAAQPQAASSSGTGSAGDVLVLPHTFEQGYVLPCRTTWAPLPLVAGSASRPGGNKAAGKSITLEDKPLLQGENRYKGIIQHHQFAAVATAALLGVPLRQSLTRSRMLFAQTW